MKCNVYRLHVWGLAFVSVLCDAALIFYLITDFTESKNIIHLLFAVAFAVITVVFGYRYPFVRFADEGVYVRRFFRTIKYEWRQFIQVGVAYPRPEWRMFNGTIYMLLPGAVKHNPNEDLAGDNMDPFLRRNVFRMFMIPGETAVLEFIHKHYGDLDFQVTEYGRAYKN